VAPVRVLIFPLPTLLHDILHKLLAEVGAVQVVDYDGEAGLAEAASDTAADLVIAEERDAAPAAACALLRARPQARALAVSHDGRSGVIYELRPHREAVGELSTATLQAAIRAAAQTGDCDLSLRDPTPRLAP
jgi:hypothetical protein